MDGRAAEEGDDYEPVLDSGNRNVPARTHARTRAHWRKFRHWRNCRDWANWHTYVPHAQLAQLPRLAGLTLAIVRTFARPECASLRIFLRPYPQAGGSGALRTTECACANNPK